MKKEPDVADGQRRDGADFLVTEAALEPEIDHFALVARQRIEDDENPGERLTRVVLFIEVTGGGGFDALEGAVPRGVSAGVEDQVPAHREQPRCEVVADPLRVLLAQPEECLLDYVPRRFEVAEQPVRISDQWPLVPFQRVDHPLRFWRPAHWLAD